MVDRDRRRPDPAAALTDRWRDGLVDQAPVPVPAPPAEETHRPARVYPREPRG